MNSADIETTEGWVEVAPDTRKYVYQWGTLATTNAIALIIHGLGEHGGRYHRLAEDFAANGIGVVAFDQQGHGHSPEPRGCVRSYRSMLDDIGVMINWCREQASTPTLFLFGHSMGGNLAINYVMRGGAGVRAVIASSPMLRAVREPSLPLEMLLRCLGWFFPNFCLRSHVVAPRLMDDPEEIEAFNQDALFHTQISLRLAAGLIDSGRWAIRNAHHLRHPTLLTHGTADLITRYDASEQFAKRAGPLCHLVLLPAALHDPFRCRIRDQVVSMYIDFMKQHLSHTNFDAQCNVMP